MATVEHFLDRYLDPVTEAFTPQLAQRILDLRAEPGVVARVEELAVKSDAGTLTSEELDEYRSLANAGTLITLLKAKARNALQRKV